MSELGAGENEGQQSGPPLLYAVGTASAFRQHGHQNPGRIRDIRSVPSGSIVSIAVRLDYN